MELQSFGPRVRGGPWTWAFLAAAVAILGLVLLAWQVGRPRPAVVIGTTSTVAGAPGAVDIEVREIAEGGGLAALQGSIKYDPALLAIKSISGTNGFMAMATDIDAGQGIARFALLNLGDGGVSTGPIARMLFQANATSGGTARIMWLDAGAAPIVLGGGDNQEITSARLVDGQVRIR
jgi:hypothetical protein